MLKYKLQCSKREGVALPTSFPPDYGVGMEVNYRGEPYVAHPGNRQGIREVEIKVMTYKGIASGAVHYYAYINYKPLYLKEDNSMRFSVSLQEDEELPQEMWGWRLQVTRKISEAELKTERFSFFDSVEEELRYTDALNSWEEIIESLKLFIPMFKGCIVKVDCYSGALEKIIRDLF